MVVGCLCLVLAYRVYVICATRCEARMANSSGASHPSISAPVKEEVSPNQRFIEEISNRILQKNYLFVIRFGIDLHLLKPQLGSSILTEIV